MRLEHADAGRAAPSIRHRLGRLPALGPLIGLVLILTRGSPC
jgi:hypothetical protein